MVNGFIRHLSVLLLFGVCCSVLTGCWKSAKAGSIRSLNDFSDTNYVCHKAKIFVMGLDYILRSSEFERTNSAFQDLGTCLAEDRRPEWGKEADRMEILAAFSEEVKALLQENPPNVAKARPIVDEMMKLADKLPGDEPFLEGTWVNLKKL